MCLTVDYQENTEEMASKLDCGAVLDLSKKSGSLPPVKSEAERDTPPFDSKYSKESVAQSHPTDSNRQYESSALINTPPHESEPSTPKTSKNLYNLANQFCPSMEMNMMNYPRIMPELQKPAVHIENTHRISPLLPSSFLQHYQTLPTTENAPNNPSIVPYSYPVQPFVAIASPSEVPVTPINQTSLVSQNNQINQSSNQSSKTQPKKPSRPFKVFPSTPSFGNDDIDHIMKELSQERYEEYRDRVLKNVERTNCKGTNIKMRRDNKNCTPTSTMQDKDEAYLEKRKKNNAAAKRSRDARKRKEDEIAIRAAYLENKVALLTQLLKKVQNENSSLKHYRDIVLRLNINMANYA